jgi:hypothetical protein
MTLPICIPRKVYAGNGVTTAFSVADDNGVAIYFAANSEIKAETAVVATGVTTGLTESIDYTLTGGPSAGLLTLTTPLPSTSVLIMLHSLLAQRHSVPLRLHHIRIHLIQRR